VSALDLVEKLGDSRCSLEFGLDALRDRAGKTRRHDGLLQSVQSKRLRGVRLLSAQDRPRRDETGERRKAQSRHTPIHIPSSF